MAIKFNNTNNKAFRPAPVGRHFGVKFTRENGGLPTSNTALAELLKGRGSQFGPYEDGVERPSNVDYQEDRGVREFDPIAQVARKVSYPRRGESRTVQAWPNSVKSRRGSRNTRASAPQYRQMSSQNLPWNQPQQPQGLPWNKPQDDTEGDVLVFATRGSDRFSFVNDRSVVMSFCINEQSPNGSAGQWIDVVFPSQGLGIADGGQGMAPTENLIPVGVGCSLYLFPILDRQTGEQQYSPNGSPKFWGNYAFINYMKGAPGAKWVANFSEGWKAQR